MHIFSSPSHVKVRAKKFVVLCSSTNKATARKILREHLFRKEVNRNGFYYRGIITQAKNNVRSTLAEVYHNGFEKYRKNKAQVSDLTDYN